MVSSNMQICFLNLLISKAADDIFLFTDLVIAYAGLKATKVSFEHK